MRFIDKPICVPTHEGTGARKMRFTAKQDLSWACTYQRSVRTEELNRLSRRVPFVNGDDM